MNQGERRGKEKLDRGSSGSRKARVPRESARPLQQGAAPKTLDLHLGMPMRAAVPCDTYVTLARPGQPGGERPPPSSPTIHPAGSQPTTDTKLSQKSFFLGRLRRRQLGTEGAGQRLEKGRREARKKVGGLAKRAGTTGRRRGREEVGREEYRCRNPSYGADCKDNFLLSRNLKFRVNQ